MARRNGPLPLGMFDEDAPGALFPSSENAPKRIGLTELFFPFFLERENSLLRVFSLGTRSFSPGRAEALALLVLRRPTATNPSSLFLQRHRQKTPPPSGPLHSRGPEVEFYPLPRQAKEAWFPIPLEFFLHLKGCTSLFFLSGASLFFCNFHGTKLHGTAFRGSQLSSTRSLFRESRGFFPAFQQDVGSASAPVFFLLSPARRRILLSLFLADLLQADERMAPVPASCRRLRDRQRLRWRAVLLFCHSAQYMSVSRAPPPFSPAERRTL